MDKNNLDKFVNAKTIIEIRIDIAKNGFVVRVETRSGSILNFVFMQPNQVAGFIQERLEKLPD